jgi:GTP-binding protein LepA
MKHIRNFSIIAHIDHGKSTLSDRMIQTTDMVSDRDFQNQMLDNMDIERERGITIKSQTVCLPYTASDGKTYALNLIDTPGHVDFTYEVSRALASCEGALLLIDASQGVEAQTLANLLLAMEHDLEIIPVINKIDLPAARPDEVAEEISDLLGVDVDEMIMISAKTGLNVEKVLEAVIERVPPPTGEPEAAPRALVFDSHYDSFKGVVAYVRVVDGKFTKRDKVMMMSTKAKFDPVEIGIFTPALVARDEINAGETGYIATGFKTVQECRVGDTITLQSNTATEPLPGYQQIKPMVFAGFYPTDNDDFEDLREAFDKLQLNDAALTFTPENSQALNFGFRVGFLGLFHMEIVQERLEREYNLDILATAPSVSYQVIKNTGEMIEIDSPAELPDPSEIDEILEPWMKIQVYTPQDYIGPVMDLVLNKRGEYVTTEYLDTTRVSLQYRMPLAEVIVDFYDRLKSVTRGYASLDYQFDNYQAENLVKLDVLVNKEPVDALAMIVHRDDAYHRGQKLVTKLKEHIPQQMFQVPIQAAVGKNVISRANVKALRKDVLSKCYGGDITRKKKLLEKQKKGKKRMKMVGQVEIPQEAFMSILSLDDD